jgi:hypothetical protein
LCFKCISDSNVPDRKFALPLLHSRGSARRQRFGKDGRDSETVTEPRA